jgi:hypothetical protein
MRVEGRNMLILSQLMIMEERNILTVIYFVEDPGEEHAQLEPLDEDEGEEHAKLDPLGENGGE